MIMRPLLRLSPVDPKWIDWATSTFNFPAPSDPMRRGVVAMTYQALETASRGEPCVIAYAWAHAIGVLVDRRSLPFVEAVGEALRPAVEVTLAAYSKSQGKARELRLPADRARELLNQWRAFHSWRSGVDLLPETLDVYVRKYGKTNRAKLIGDEKAAWVDVSDAPGEFATLLTNLHRPFKDETIIDRIRARIEELEAQPVDASRDARILSLYRLEHELGHGESLSLSWSRSYSDGANYRLYGSASNMKSDDRAAVFPASLGYVEVDLRNAHLAILGMLLKSERIAALAGDAWSTLGDYVDGAASKGQLKRFLYSCMYGAGREQRICALVKDDAYDVAQALYDKGEDERAHLACFPIWHEAEALHDRLVKHPTIGEVIEGTRQLARELERAARVDPFGIEHGGPETRGVTALSSLCSAYEKWLLAPVYCDRAYLKTHQVILDQHDGLTVKLLGADRTYPDGRTLGGITYQRLERLVNDRAKAAEINTQLLRKQ